MRLKHFIFGIAAPLTIGGIIYSVQSQMTPKPLRSFVVTSVMSSPQQNSPYLFTSAFTRAVRADGSWVEIWTSKNIGGQDYYERDINDFESGMLTIVEEATKSIVRKSIPLSEHKHRLAAAASCEGSPAGQILNLAVNYSETTRSIVGNEKGDATEVVYRWLVPELGCFVLQKETKWIRKSDGFLLVDTKVTPISVSFQPVDEFFEVPTSYTERTKEEVLRQLSPLG